MGVLYLVEQNTVLRKSGDRLVFCKKPPSSRKSSGLRQYDILMEWPCADVEHVMIFGNIQITTQALCQLLEHGIETALFSLNGTLLGQVTPPCAKNILLRLKQYKKFEDIAFKNWFSKFIVLQKLEAARQLLKDYEHNHPGTFLKDELKYLERLPNEIDTALNPDSLLGIEGAASAGYFKLLGRLLPKEFQFNGRSRRPPKDPPNAVLSFGYTIVASELGAILDGAGFDPFLGFYHQPVYGRAGLALDLLELYRHTFIDRLMLNLFHLGILKTSDFFPVGGGGIYLSPDGKKKFFQQYERMAGKYTDETQPLPVETGFRKKFQDRVLWLQKIVQDEIPLKSSFEKEKKD